MIGRWLSRSLAFVALLALLVVPEWASPGAVSAEDFYAGKTMRMMTGFSPGGGVDTRARLFARYLPKYIPGNPDIIVQTMAGAGGIVAANYTFNVAKPDGLTIIHFPSSTVMNTFLAGKRVQYDIRNVPIIWLQPDSWVTMINPKDTGVNTVSDIPSAKTKIAAGGTGVTSLRSLRPKLALLLFGVDHTWVTGYRGTSGLFAAFDRGEIHMAEMPLSSLKGFVMPRVEEGKAAILWQTGTLDENEKFVGSNLVPDIPTLDKVLPAGKKEGLPWEGWKAAVAPQSFQTAVGVPGGVPKEQLAILGRAFQAMNQDSGFKREFERAFGIPVTDAMAGQEAMKVVSVGLNQLFERYQQGVDFLRTLPKK